MTADHTTASATHLTGADASRRQFDFWIGSWDVFDAQTNEPIGASLIESVYSGCALRENWTERGFSGGSLNAFNIDDGQWHQTWTDSSGTWREFVGGLADGRMVLVWRHASVLESNVTIHERMTFTLNTDGAVRQYSDQSNDGVNWTARYDYIYRRRTASAHMGIDVTGTAHRGSE